MPLDLNTPLTPESLPAEFQSAEYFKPIKTVGDLIKSYAGVQPLIGQKALTAPKDDAPVEEWDNYYTKLGRPKTPEEYDVKPDEKATDMDKKFLGSMMKSFHTAGLTPRQVKQIIAGYAPVVKSLQDESMAASQADFDKRMGSLFGAEKDAQFNLTKKLLKDHAPESIRQDIDGLDNKSFTILSAVINSVAKKYMKESDLAPGKGDGSSEDTKEALDKELRDLMKTPGYEDYMHPDHASLMTKRDAIRDRMQKVFAKNN